MLMSKEMALAENGKALTDAKEDMENAETSLDADSKFLKQVSCLFWRDVSSICQKPKRICQRPKRSLNTFDVLLQSKTLDMRHE